MYMYRLVVDSSPLNDYKVAIAPAGNSNPNAVTQSLYLFLRQHGRPLDDTIFSERVSDIKMLVTIRTDLTNEVLVPDDGKFYTDCTASYPSRHNLDDTVMLSAKSLVDKLFDCGDNIPLVIRRTTVYPTGACINDNQVYVYVMVVIDHTLKADEIFNIKGCHFENISDLSADSQLETELLKRLTIVKGDSKNA